MSKTVYTFSGVTFVRQAGGEFERWFADESSYSVNKILRGSSRRVVIDVAGASWPKLALRAQLATLADVATLRGLARQAGTLSSTRGRSARVFLAGVAEPEASNTSYGLTLDLTFERLS